MDLDAFVAEHGDEWNRLRGLLARRRRRLTAAEVDEMVMLYRRTATHLSVVRSRSPDPALVSWLSHLVLQARGTVSPVDGFSLAAVGRFFTVSFPVAVYRATGWWAGVATAFVGVSAVLMALVATEPERALAFMSQREIDQIVTHDFEAYYSEYPPENFAALVWTNNALIAGLCLASGVLLFPVLLVLWSNALNIGVIGGVMIAYGRADVFFGLLTVHGLLELTCVFIAAGVGLRIGWSWIAPGPYRTRAQALGETARAGMVVALGVVVALGISGLVEAFVTPSVLPLPVKLLAGVLVWLAFLGYIIGFGAHAAAQGATGDVADHERAATVHTV